MEGTHREELSVLAVLEGCARPPRDVLPLRGQEPFKFSPFRSEAGVHGGLRATARGRVNTSHSPLNTQNEPLTT
jgi:hypothetical protein